MGVQAARIQQVIKGDDASFVHKLVKPGVVGNVETQIPVVVNTGDVVTASYQTTQPASGPAEPPVDVVATFTPGSSQIAVVLTPVQSNTLQSGLGQTVRIKIVRDTSLLVETLYLYKEYDCVERGFPSAPSSLNLP